MTCNHCPLAGEGRPCPGERNTRVCSNADPESPTHRPEIIAKILGWEGPGILVKIRSFAVAVVAHVAAGRPLCTPEQHEARLAICRACENYVDGACRLCGCNMALKVTWAEQACPIGLWGPSPIVPDI